MGASVLVNSTRHGYGKEMPKERQQVDGRWVIVNVLWERKLQSARFVYHSDGPAVRLASPFGANVVPPDG